MKKFISFVLVVVAMATMSFAASPQYTTREVWSPSVVETTSTWNLADNVYLKDIECVNLTTGVVTFAIKASSAIVGYEIVPVDGTKTFDVDEKWSAVTVYIDTTHSSSNTWNVTMSSVNKIGVLYRYNTRW